MTSKNFIIIFLVFVIISNGGMGNSQDFQCSKGDERYGICTVVWADGTRYKGEIQGGQMDGHGTIIYPSGSKFTGTFEDNYMIEGTYTWSDGSKYSGTFIENKRDGLGTFYNPKGRIIFYGLWREDALITSLENIESIPNVEWIIKPKYEMIKILNNNLIAVNTGGKRENDEAKGGYWQLVNRKGELISKEKFSKICEFSDDGMANFEIRDDDDYDTIYFGRINSNGKIVSRLPNILNKEWIIKHYTNFNGGRAIIECYKKNNFSHGAGVINTKGEMVVEPKFDKAYAFSEGLAAIKIKEKWGYMDKDGHIIIEPQFEEAGIFSEGIARIGIDSHYGYINKEGRIIIEPRFNLATEFKNGIAKVGIGKYSYIATKFREGFVGKYGYINTTGEFVIDMNYSELGDFEEGLAYFVEDGFFSNHKYGYMDNKGNIIIKPQFDKANDFSDGVAYVEKYEAPNFYGFIKRDGVICFKDEDTFFESGAFREGLNPIFTYGSGKEEYYTKIGFRDKKGNVIIEPIFNQVKFSYNGLIGVNFGWCGDRMGKWGLIKNPLFIKKQD